MTKNRNLAQNPQQLHFLYDLAVRLTWIFLHIPALFQPKIHLFVKGRKKAWGYLKSFRDPGRQLIWMHTASLGEFEQGLPVLERLMQAYPGHQYLVTFFSPSGYEVRKGRIPGVGMCYLPLDTRRNARRFLRLVRPEIALFVKYEVWPNFFFEMGRYHIPILLISARFRPGQVYFKRYGRLMKQALGEVRHFFVQDEVSARLLKNAGFAGITVSGDTRLDRVLEIRNRDNTLDFMESFKSGRTCLVAGSTWTEDEQVILPLVNTMAGDSFCFVIAPHNTDTRTVMELMGSLTARSARYSDWQEGDSLQADVLVVDTIGLLTRIYSYADIAYVGGGFATGLHNTLEPAVFGIPVLIGPRYQDFREARQLVGAGGILTVTDPAEFDEKARELLQSADLRKGPGAINREFVEKNAGASVQILAEIRKLIR